MTVATLWLLTAAALIAAGLWRVVTAATALRQVVALNVVAAGATVLLVAVGEVGAAPDPREARTMAAAGVVVMLGVTAFAVRLLRHPDHDAGRGGADP